MPRSTGEWRNTLDGAAPESQVEELGATQPSPRFEVRWSGVDEGAGIRDYTVFVSEDGGPYTPWLRHTSDTSAIFPGQEGRGYRFYSIASDQASNLEEAPGAPDAVTRTPESHGDSQPSDGGPPLGGGGPLLGGDGPFLGSRYSSADLRADLVSDLRSVARALRRLGVRRVQRRKVVRHRFTPLLAGTTAVTWNAQAQPPASRRPVVIARGRATAREAGPLTVRVRLTRAGRKLLRRSGRLRIALSATFRPEIGAAVSATARVAFLRRR